jgi:hypothetical protein
VPSMARTLADLVAQTDASAIDARALSWFVERLEASSCSGLAGKVAEYKGCGPRADDLIAELRIAFALSDATRATVELQEGAVHDLRLRAPGLDCTVEVEHKSSVSAFAAVFYPDPDAVAAYGRVNGGWQAASFRLQETLEGLPFDIQPLIDGELSEPRWGGHDRAKQEEVCGQLAQWLVQKVTDIPRGESARLRHEHAHFDITPLAAPPGRIKGHAPLGAFVLNDRSLSEWLRGAIHRKTKIAAEHPTRRGEHHLIGLVIDEPFACTGRDLAAALLGGLVADFGDFRDRVRLFRPVPVEGRGLLDAARDRGRSELLSLMKFDRERPSRLGEEGLFFDKAVYEHIDGVLALYYTDQLQFIANPFTARNVDPVCALFPLTLDPFGPSLP